MRQSRMFLNLSLKRATKKLPQLILGSLAVSAVVVIVVLFCAYSRNTEGVLAKTRIAIAAGNNDFFRDLAGKILGDMESGGSMLSFETEDKDEALKKFADGRLEGVIAFPDDYIGQIGRGEDVPATIYIKSDGVAYDLGIIVHLASSAERYLAAAEASNFAVTDMLMEYGYTDIKTEYDEEIDMMNMRMVLSREGDFTKITVLGSDGTTMTQSYACAALVMLILLWGLSCGAMIKSEGQVMSGKLMVSGVSVLKQELIRLVSLIYLLGIMLLLVFAALIAAFPFAASAFEQINVYSADVLVLLFLAFIPSLILAATVVLFAFTVSANEIGGILLLFTGTIVMGYISGCLLPSVYLPMSIRRAARWLPTTYMHRGAQKALNGMIDTGSMLICLAFAALFFTISVLIKKCKLGRESA